MRLHSFIAATVLWACCAGQVLAESVEQWLVRMDHAVASISYRGTVVSTGSDRIDTMRVLHRVDDGGVRERIVAAATHPRHVGYVLNTRVGKGQAARTTRGLACCGTWQTNRNEPRGIWTPVSRA